MSPTSSSGTPGSGTKASTPTYARNVTASSTNRIVNVVGLPTTAIRPAASPPSPIPRFIVTRCCANAACRRAAGVRREMSVDWLGQKPALPAPSIAIRTNASHGTRTSGRNP